VNHSQNLVNEVRHDATHQVHLNDSFFSGAIDAAQSSMNPGRCIKAARVAKNDYASRQGIRSQQIKMNTMISNSKSSWPYSRNSQISFGMLSTITQRSSQCLFILSNTPVGNDKEFCNAEGIGAS
jgi:hypothetical protein